MRSAAAPLQRFIPCRCGEQHPAKVMIQGIPLLVCPKEQGDVVHAAFTEQGTLYLLIGKAV